MKKVIGVVLLIIILAMTIGFTWFCSISQSISFGHHPLEKIFGCLTLSLLVIYFALYPTLFVMEACFNKSTWHFRYDYYSWLSELLMTFVDFFNFLTGLVKKVLGLLRLIKSVNVIERP